MSKEGTETFVPLKNCGPLQVGPVRERPVCTLTAAELNHLRRLLGWMRCEIGQPPDEMVPMVQGFAIQQTYTTGLSDFPGCEVLTMSPGGPGRMVGCWKCSACGWSVTKTRADESGDPCQKGGA